MSESSSEESDITRLSHIASSTERHSSAVDIACDASQNRFGSIYTKSRFLTAELPGSYYQGLVLIYKVLLPFS